jgi:hypothetical protein
MNVDEWSPDRWIGISGTSIGIIGIAFSVWTWKKSRREVQIQYRSNFMKLIGPYSSESPFSITDFKLRVQYGRKEALQVSKIYLAVWNRGLKALDPGSMNIKGEALRVILPEDCEFWGPPKILKQTRVSLGFHAVVDEDRPNIAHLHFDFLDHLDGAVIEFLCSGPAEKYQVKGEYIGAQPIENRGYLPLKEEISYRDQWIRVAGTWNESRRDALIAVPIMTLLFFTLFLPFFSLLGSILSAPFMVAAILLVGISGAAFLEWRTSGQLKNVPKPLRRIPIPSLGPKSQHNMPVVRFFEDLLLTLGAKK